MTSGVLTNCRTPPGDCILAIFASAEHSGSPVESHLGKLMCGALSIAIVTYFFVLLLCKCFIILHHYVSIVLYLKFANKKCLCYILCSEYLINDCVPLY